MIRVTVSWLLARNREPLKQENHKVFKGWDIGKSVLSIFNFFMGVIIFYIFRIPCDTIMISPRLPLGSVYPDSRLSAISKRQIVGTLG